METFHIEKPEDRSSQPNSLVHPTAIIHPTAQISASVEIGPYAVIGENVVIKEQSKIASHAVIEYAEIGSACQIFPHAFIGTAPQDLKYRGEKTKVIIGDGTIIRECVTVNRGTTYSGQTIIGKKCLLMAYAHVAHDCILEDEVILANSVAVAGHVRIDFATIVGGLSGIHQFVHIGKLTMIGAGSMVPLDVPPFCTVAGDRAKIVGLNLEGMRRRHYSKNVIDAIKKIYRQVFISKKTLAQTIQNIETKLKPQDDAKKFIEFIKNSQRGICRPRQKIDIGATDTW